eukprot:GHUV01021111.1.p1 GENE.GHUV01021111.1~~GHUV01021111.1.p1  ORF type:complete len:370 (+),score=93.09 GHUV01021111.1:245-1354(+)
MKCLVASVLVCLVAFLCPVSSSEGDAAPLFQDCHAHCLRSGCTKTPGHSGTCNVACPGLNHFRPSWSLRFMRWDCTDDCSYNCMWAIEPPKAKAAAGPVYKYFGKWPFVRILGAQEIASVVFSLANMLAHIHNMQLYWQHLKGIRCSSKVNGNAGGFSKAAAASAAGQYSYQWLWIVYSVVNVNAWLWSSVFHCRDTRITERFDYFSADLTVAVGLAVAVARILQLHSVLHIVLLTFFVGSGLAQHVHYMAFVKFDYGYNMKVCIAVGLLTACAWLTWVTAVQHPGRRILYQFMGLVHAAMLLEVLDFPPLLWLFDAHALWHAATVPLTYLWYKFVFADVAWVTQQHSRTVAVNPGQHGLSEPSGKQKQ